MRIHILLIIVRPCAFSLSCNAYSLNATHIIYKIEKHKDCFRTSYNLKQSMNLLNKYYPVFINEAKAKITDNYCLAAGILYKNTLINKPCCNAYRNYCRGSICSSLHAETNALLNFFGKDLQFDIKRNKWYFLQTKIKKIKNINMIVIRFFKDGQTGNARPCYNCLKMMKDLGVNKVYYSTGNSDGMVCEQVKNMVSIQVSSISRFLNNSSRFSNHDVDITSSLSNINTNKEIYYENLIKTVFPKRIQKKNLEYFIEYNFTNYLPDCSYILVEDNVYFYNKKNQKIVSAKIT